MRISHGRDLARTGIVLAGLALVGLAGCGGECETTRVALPWFTGPLFHLVLLLAVLFAINVANQKGEATEDSLFKLGNRMRDLEDRLDEIQRLLEQLGSAGGDAATPAGKKTGGTKKGGGKADEPAES